jgi:DNA repair protein SbcD/Mre11
VVLVRGNHDAESQITKSLTLPSNVRELSTRKPETYVLESIGVAFHGQGFANKAVSADIAARYPQAKSGLFNVGVLHTCVEGRVGHEPYAPCSIATLVSKGYDYWALGHVHAREVLSREPWIVFPGNLQGRHAKETGPKGATLVTVVDGRIESAEHRPVDVVRWCACEVDITGAERADDVVDAVKGALAKAAREADGRTAAARVRIVGAARAHVELQADPERWINEIRVAATDSGDIWVEKVIVDSKTPIDLEKIRADGGAIGDLARSIQQLEGDDARLVEYAAVLKELHQKLPADAREEVGIKLDDPETVRRVLGDVEQMLLARLSYRAQREGGT